MPDDAKTQATCPCGGLMLQWQRDYEVVLRCVKCGEQRPLYGWPSLTDYSPGPPISTGTAKVNYVDAGKGEAMAYPDPLAAMRVDDEKKIMLREMRIDPGTFVEEIFRLRSALAASVENVRRLQQGAHDGDEAASVGVAASPVAALKIG